MKINQKSLRCPPCIAPSWVGTEKWETPALRKATLNISQKATFKSIPSGVSRVQLLKQFHTFSHQLQHFCPLKPSPNWKNTIYQRQCCYFSSAFLYLFIALFTSDKGWEMETFRGFKAIPQKQHLKGNSGTQWSSIQHQERFYLLKKDRETQILAKKSLWNISFSF